MANYSKSKNKNTVFGGTDSIIVPTGNTAERAGTELGQIRYNTDLGFLEQYNATGWAGIDAPPTVSSISGTINEDTDSTITITGSNFKSGSIVSVEGNGVSGSSRNLSTTFVNSGELTAATNASSVSYVGGATFTIKVTNPSGLAAILEPAGTIDRDPVWSTGAGSLGNIYDSERGSKTFTVTALDPDGTGVTYQIVSGAIPPGMSFNTSNGDITGTPNAVGGDTTSTFTVRATSNGQTDDRTFSITVRAPVVQTFNYTGGWQTFTAPSGPTRLRVKLWGAGGARRFSSLTNAHAGGGGFTDVTLSYSGTPSLSIAVGGAGGVGASGAGGGGSTSIMTTSSLSQGNAIAVAGGGGGSHGDNGNEYAGAGGGTSGQGGTDEGGDSRATAPSRSGGSGTGGGGGTQSQGGQNGNNTAATTNATSGGAFSGGRGTGNSAPSGQGWPDGGGGSSSGGSNGGGGGGGYYGGGGAGGGSPNNGSAGGGSGYVHSGTRGSWTVVSGTSYTGNNNNIPTQGSSDANYPGGNIGQGSTADDTPGNNGAVVIIY